MSPQIKAQLAPHGSLRAAINMGNFLLVTGKAPNGDPDGVSPDMARAIAEKLGVPVTFVPYAKPSDLADAAGTDTWDKVAVLDAWRSGGRAPEVVEAQHLTNGQVDKTRPLCAYPKVAAYKGSGDTNIAANFECRNP